MGRYSKITHGLIGLPVFSDQMNILETGYPKAAMTCIEAYFLTSANSLQKTGV